MPMASNPAWNFLLCLSAVASLFSIALMPVAATCGGVFRARNVPPSAAVCSAVNPNWSATDPLRLRILSISEAVAFALLDRWLMASPSWVTPSVSRSKIVRKPAIAPPASPAEMPKATPIFTDCSVNFSNSSVGIFACPPAATMEAISLAAIGSLPDICKIPVSMSANLSAGISPSTLLTSAMALSKLRADETERWIPFPTP